MNAAPTFVDKGDVAGFELAAHALIASAFREDPEIISIVLSNRQGLPIVSETRENPSTTPTLAAMGTMCIGAARRAAEALALPAPERLVVSTPEANLFVVATEGSQVCLVARVEPNDDLSRCSLVLHDLCSMLVRLIRGEGYSE